MTTLQTDRLILRPYQPEDAARIQQLADDYDVAKTLGGMPHPYTLEAAQSFIEYATTTEVEDVFAIVRREGDVLMGACGIMFPNPPDSSAEIGYWLGKAHWGQGYATEAARRVIRYGFENTDVPRIFARYFAANPASRRVMEKAGMKFEGMLRHHIERMGTLHDIGFCGILRTEFATPTADEITLVPVSEENWEAAMQIKVFPHQEVFIPTVQRTLASAYVQAKSLTIMPYIMEAFGRNIGFVTVKIRPGQPPVYWIHGFMIDQAYQGQGYGKAALAHLIGHIYATFPNCPPIHLSVHPDNVAAIHLYEQAGFREAGWQVNHEQVYTLV